MVSNLGTELPDQLCELLVPSLEERLPSRGCDSRLSAPPGTKTILRWAKWTSHFGVIPAISCLRKDHVSNKTHKGCIEET